jgi:MerR family transcriptional regulator, mercuric resistance operon regulatory protein
VPITVSRAGGLSIGGLAEASGVHLETIRYYERIGLIPEPPRTGGGHRVYGEAHLGRLVFVRRARELGFTLDQVRSLLALADDRDRSCAEARDIGAARLAETRAKIADLRRMERVLNEMVARCADGTLPNCPLIETLSRGADGGDVR